MLRSFRMKDGMCFTGAVVPSTSYDPPDTFRVETDIEDFPYRVLFHKNIAEIDDEPFEFTPRKVVEMRVQGSGNNTYMVKSDGLSTTCTCPGFAFRKTCKHIKLVTA